MCAVAGEGADARGWLLCKEAAASAKGAWARRWFVLTPSSLSYLCEPFDADAIESVPVCELLLATVRDHGGGCSPTRSRCSRRTRPLTLQACDGVFEAEEWKARIRGAIGRRLGEQAPARAIASVSSSGELRPGELRRGSSGGVAASGGDALARALAARAALSSAPAIGGSPPHDARPLAPPGARGDASSPSAAAARKPPPPPPLSPESAERRETQRLAGDARERLLRAAVCADCALASPPPTGSRSTAASCSASSAPASTARSARTSPR